MKNADELNRIATEIKRINDFLIETYEETEAYTVSHLMKLLKTEIARTNELYANAEYALNVAKGEASEQLYKDNPRLTATQYKDVLNLKIAREIKVFRYVERTNASIVHIIDILRSQLSFLKAEYNQQNAGGVEG